MSDSIQNSFIKKYILWNIILNSFGHISYFVIVQKNYLNKFTQKIIWNCIVPCTEFWKTCALSVKNENFISFSQLNQIFSNANTERVKPDQW